LRFTPLSAAVPVNALDASLFDRALARGDRSFRDTYDNVEGAFVEATGLLDALARLMENFQEADEIELHSAVMEAAYDKIVAANKMLNQALEAARVKPPVAQTPAAARTAKRPSVSKAVKPRRR
jgi:hypothetical protein